MSDDEELHAAGWIQTGHDAWVPPPGPDRAYTTAKAIEHLRRGMKITITVNGVGDDETEDARRRRLTTVLEEMLRRGGGPAGAPA